jgi:hypothetical protein
VRRLALWTAIVAAALIVGALAARAALADDEQVPPVRPEDFRP